MEMKGERRIEAPREAVWEALNDPAVLQASIPGCEELEKTSANGFTAKVKAKVGPVSAKFTGAVTLSDINPPEGYRISGEGKGGAAGFAKGGATVKLAEDGSATILTYEVDAQVGGKLAQIGSRLIDGTARKMAEQFFTAFSEQVAGKQAPAEVAAESPAAVTPPAAAPAPEAQAPADHGHDDHDHDAGHHGPPEPIKDPNVGAGVKPGIYITAAIIVAILLFFIFGLGGGGEMGGN